MSLRSRRRRRVTRKGAVAPNSAPALAPPEALPGACRGFRRRIAPLAAARGAIARPGGSATGSGAAARASAAPAVRFFL